MRHNIAHALIQDENINFAVVSVVDAAIAQPEQAEKLVETLQAAYGCPVVLMGQDNHQLFGRQDIVDFLNQFEPGQLPWEETTIDIPDPSRGEA
ncbi:MAG: hypothetical protein ACLFQ3_09240 [Thiohalorhabdus sp.]